MATITGFTKARMEAIEAASVVDGEVIADHLILTRHDSSTIDAGNVRGEQGPMGLGPGIIPGELRIFSGSVLPDPDIYSLWVWANGAAYASADHPIAASHISTAWRTFGGASDPGVGFFRVPDMRGLVPAGLDQMPSGARANRMTRSAAITLAAITGEETHVLTEAEMPSHDHPSSNGDPFGSKISYSSTSFSASLDGGRDTHLGDTAVGFAGGDDPHENVQPTVMVGYIVSLDS